MSQRGFSWVRVGRASWACWGWFTGSSAVRGVRVERRAGVWGSAVEVPGTATLNSGGDAAVSSVSCAAAGRLRGGRLVPRTAPATSRRSWSSETNGSWGNAVEVPGTATLNSGGDAMRELGLVCRGRATARPAATTPDGSGHVQAFVVERDERPAGATRSRCRARRPSTAAASPTVNSVSCAAAGRLCGRRLLHGRLRPLSRRSWSSETNGSWGNAVEVPGAATLDGSGNARGVLGPVCRGGRLRGQRLLHATAAQPLRDVDDRTRRNDRTGNAVEMPGTSDPGRRRQRRRRLGFYVCSGEHLRRPAAVSRWTSCPGPPGVAWCAETNGGWDDAIEVPGAATLDSDGSASVELSVVCLGSCLRHGAAATRDGYQPAPRRASLSRTNGSSGDAGRSARHRDPGPQRQRSRWTRCHVQRRAPCAGRRPGPATAPAHARPSW